MAKCMDCGEKGKCRWCRGKGKNNDGTTCQMCLGSGICSKCNGTKSV